MSVPLEFSLTLSLYADLTGLVNTCIFHADGSLNGGSSAQACQGFASCTSCAANYNLNAGQCVLKAAVSAPVSLPVSIRKSTPWHFR